METSWRLPVRIRRWTHLITVAVLPALLLSSCKTASEKPTTEESAYQMPCIKVQSKLLDRVDQLPGEIQAYQDVAIYPKVPGFIKWIGIDRGSTVKEGQVMVRLIAPELLAQRNEAFQKQNATDGDLHQAEAQLASSKASMLDAQAKMLGDDDTYERTKQASTVPGVVSPNEVIVLEKIVEADRERVHAWQDNVKAAQNQVLALTDSVKASKRATENYQDIQDYLTITAPFDGYITERNMHVGSFCGPLGKGAYPPIVRIQELKLLRIVTPVPETEAGGVEAGAKVEFSVSTHPGERFVGTVARIGNYLEQKTRTMPVELNYWNPGWRVLPGMFCEVYWPTKRQHPTLFVPATAVVTTSTLETFVLRIKSDIVEWVKVKRGLTMGNLTEVFGELKEGDLVALHGSDEITPGTKVAAFIEPNPEENKARPSYNASGASLSMPDGERQELSHPENKGKPHAIR